MRTAYRPAPAPRAKSEPSPNLRITVLFVFFVLLGLVIIGRFFQLQILEHRMYEVLASDQHEIQKSLIPDRGTIYLRDPKDGQLYPIAKDRPMWQVYGVPREMKDASSTATILSDLLGIDRIELLQKFAVTSSAYKVLAQDVPFEKIEALREKNLQAIGITKGSQRWYPEQGLGGQVIGFTQLDENDKRVGRYGLEGYENELLSGEPGHLMAETDAAGRRIAIGETDFKEARNGADLVLTLDRAIQFKACERIKQALVEFEAESGSILVMDAKTGAVLAMCSAPDFAPEDYRKVKDVGVFNNPATFYQFEPGSIFKPLTLAAAINAGKILPTTTYNDTGEEKIDDFTIRNSDKLAHGLQTMNGVLEKSLNTGTIFVQRQLGKDLFREYVKRWGFGVKTNLEVTTEAKGNISSLDRKGSIYAATASFGQGIAVTPIQMLTAFSSLANKGTMMKPYLIDEVRYPDGSVVKTKPEVIRDVVTPRTAQLTTGMLINVVENGHGKRAGVPGYYVAGKTGTAQVANPKGGYLEGVTIGSFIGYAPAEDPKFTMLVKIDKPKTVAFAESSAAPVFGDMAKFLLNYFQVPPERPIVEKKEEALPVLPVTTSTPVVKPNASSTSL